MYHYSSIVFYSILFKNIKENTFINVYCMIPLSGLQTATKTVAFATKNIHLRVMFLLRSPLATI